MRLRRWTRPARHALALLLLRGLAGALRLLPRRLALWIGAGLGRLIGRLARADRRRAEAHLALLPDPPEVGDCFADLGRRIAELMCAHRVLPRVHLDPGAAEAYTEALAAGRGVLVATAHLGNWELMAAALARDGYPVLAVGARQQSGPIFRWLARTRVALGVEVIGPGGGARAAIAALRRGAVVALFVDQATRERSRPVPFLGRLAPTPTTIERLHAATGAPVLLVWSAREGDRHRVRAEACPPTLEALTARVEAAVRAYPTQWIWQHDRWRDPCPKRPPGAPRRAR